MFELLYVICAFLWATCACFVQGKMYPESEMWRYILVFVVHLAFYPIMMVFGMIHIVRAM